MSDLSKTQCTSVTHTSHNARCRIAFCGRILASVDPKNSDSMKRVKVIKQKQKEGRLDRVEKGDKRPAAACQRRQHRYIFWY